MLLTTLSLIVFWFVGFAVANVLLASLVGMLVSKYERPKALLLILGGTLLVSFVSIRHF